MNKVVLMGRLTRDPEIRYTQNNNTLIASFSLAVNRRFSKTGESDFININAWDKTGEFVSKYFKKGQQVSIIGRMQTRSWDDENGKKRYATDVVAEEVFFADSKKESYDQSDSFDTTFGTMPNSAQTENKDSDFKVDTGDDLPF